MSYYPMIDYVGAYGKMADQWQDLPRVDREREEAAMRRALQDKQMTLYDLQSRKAGLEMDELESNRAFDKTLASDIAARRAAGDFDPTVTEKTVPDYSVGLGGDEYSVPGERTLRASVAPKLNIADYAAQKYLEGGKYKESLGMQREARLMEAEKEKVFNQRMDSITKAAKISPTLARSVKAMYAKQDPTFDLFGDIIQTTEGPKSIPIKNPNTGMVEAIQFVDENGHPHGSPYAFKGGGFDPKDVASLEKATAALALAKTPEEVAQAQAVVTAMQGASVWKRKMEAANPIREPKSPEEIEAKKVDLELKKKRLNDLENKVSAKDFRDYTNAQNALRNIEMQELQGMIVDKDKADKIKSVHQKTMERVEAKASGGEKKEAPKGHPLSGQKAGRYKVNGKIIKWDGSKEI